MSVVVVVAVALFLALRTREGGTQGSGPLSLLTTAILTTAITPMLVIGASFPSCVSVLLLVRVSLADKLHPLTKEQPIRSLER